MITSTISALLASGVIAKVCTGMFGVSTVLTAAKNSGAKHRIERKGYIVGPDKRSISERVMSTIKDYFFLLVPGYNIYKSFKKFLTNDKLYANERMELYKDRDRLFEDTPEVEVKPKKEAVKTETREEEVVKAAPVVKKAEKKSEVVSESPRVETVIPFAGLTLVQLEDLKKHYERIDANLRKKHERRSAAGAPVEELNAIAIDTIENKKLYEMVVARINEIKLERMTESTRGTTRRLVK